MSRYTANDLEKACDNWNAELEKLGIPVSFRASGRNGYTAVDEYRREDIHGDTEDWHCWQNTACGSPRECYQATRTVYAFRLVEHYRKLAEPCLPKPAEDAPTVPSWSPTPPDFTPPGRSPYELAGPSRVAAWSLLYAGKPAGKIVADYPGGSVTAGVWVWGGPLANLPGTWARVTGNGYCRFSAAVCKALALAIKKTPTTDPSPETSKALLESVYLLDGAGPGRVENWFRSFGYVVAEVISPN